VVANRLEGGAVRVVGGGTGDQDVVVGPPVEGAGQGPGDEQVAAAVAFQDIAAEADKDVVARAAGDAVDIPDAAPATGGHAGREVGVQVGGGGAIVRRVGAGPAVDGAGELEAVAEDERVVVHAPDQVLDLVGPERDVRPDVAVGLPGDQAPGVRRVR